MNVKAVATSGPVFRRLKVALTVTVEAVDDRHLSKFVGPALLDAVHRVGVQSGALADCTLLSYAHDFGCVAVTVDHSVENSYPSSEGQGAEAAMPAHQQRVVDEHADLMGRLKKLDAFILDNPVFLTLQEAEQARLKRQSVAMGMYAGILEDRIKHFEVVQ